MSSVVLVGFIEFCLASWNGKVVNIPVIFLASLSLSLVSLWVHVFKNLCVGKTADVLCVFKKLIHTTWRYFYIRLSWSSSSLDLCGAETFRVVYILEPLAAFNASSPFLSPSGLITSKCRWGQQSPKGLAPVLPLIDQVGPQGEMEIQEDMGQKSIVHLFTWKTGMIIFKIACGRLWLCKYPFVDL